MKIYSSFPQSYIPLAPVCLFCLYASFTTSHTICLLILTVIFCTGINQQSYYNMAISAIIVIMCMGHNLQQAGRFFQIFISDNLSETFINLVFNIQFYLLLMQGSVLIVVLIESLRKYHRFKNEAFDINVSW